MVGEVEVGESQFDSVIGSVNLNHVKLSKGKDSHLKSRKKGVLKRKTRFELK